MPVIWTRPSVLWILCADPARQNYGWKVCNIILKCLRCDLSSIVLTATGHFQVVSAFFLVDFSVIFLEFLAQMLPIITCLHVIIITEIYSYTSSDIMLKYI